MEELTEQFIRERMILKNVSPATVDWYRSSFRAFERAVHSKAAITERIGVLKNRGVQAVSINAWLRCLNAFHRWGKEEGHLTGDLVHIPRLKQEQKVLETLTPEQVQRIVRFRPRTTVVSEHRSHTLACLLLDTGLRIDEALSLTREDVDIDNRLLRVHGKGGKQRLVPISYEGRKVLWRWMSVHRQPLVFANRNGVKPGQRNLLREFKLFGKKLGITGVRFSFHTMRHCFALGYVKNGGDVFRLQRVLGHSTLDMTRKYVNLQTADLSSVHDRFSIIGTGR